MASTCLKLVQNALGMMLEEASKQWTVKHLTRLYVSLISLLSQHIYLIAPFYWTVNSMCRRFYLFVRAKGMIYSVSTEDWHNQIQALEKSLAAKKNSLETTYMVDG